ncbi:HNH endonuclease [bacterium BMS3Bbin13]|nr:HNH endonuclease [bacterium BMS3Bbin13]
MAVLILDKRKNPLMPCSEKRARLLLERGRARVHRKAPFIIRLVDRGVEDSALQPLRLKLDPGSKTTGIALVRERETVDPATGKSTRAQAVVFLAELAHRGHLIRDRLTARRAFRRRRRGTLRYRAPRFLNRTRPRGWLAPSLRHRVDTTMAWVDRLMRWAPVAGLSTLLHRFDTQALQNPEISGIEYQQGTLTGYEVREYLLEKWGWRCAYCDVENVPLTVDHIHPKSRGGSDRVSNLALACVPCNQRKGNRDVTEFLLHDPKRLAHIEAQRKAPLKDAAAVNSTRWALLGRLKETGLDVEVGTGGRTKYNRARQQCPKTHWVDAACGGPPGALVRLDPETKPLAIRATGHGERQRARLNRYGFPRGHKPRRRSFLGWRTGAIARCDKPGVRAFVGRVAIRFRPSFVITGPDGKKAETHPKYLHIVQKGDGYAYA